jgi:tRNA G10  N-methylase Trm11
VLQEALLMGYSVYGTDIDERMIDYSNQNLEWLAERKDFSGQTMLLETGDATSYDWQDFDAIACETYLGRPFSAPPKPEILQDVMQDVDTIHKKFLQNVAKQTEPGFRMCIAVPAWRTNSGFKHLKTLDKLEDLGYTRVSFVHADTRELIYHRENQVVGRELVTLIRK